MAGPSNPSDLDLSEIGQAISRKIYELGGGNPVRGMLKVGLLGAFAAALQGCIPKGRGTAVPVTAGATASPVTLPVTEAVTLAPGQVDGQPSPDAQPSSDAIKAATAEIGRITHDSLIEHLRLGEFGETIQVEPGESNLAPATQVQTGELTLHDDGLGFDIPITAVDVSGENDEQQVTNIYVGNILQEAKRLSLDLTKTYIRVTNPLDTNGRYQARVTVAIADQNEGQLTDRYEFGPGGLNARVTDERGISLADLQKELTEYIATFRDPKPEMVDILIQIGGIGLGLDNFDYYSGAPNATPSERRHEVAVFSLRSLP